MRPENRTLIGSLGTENRFQTVNTTGRHAARKAQFHGAIDNCCLSLFFCS